jgi:hypothetical protein
MDPGLVPENGETVFLRDYGCTEDALEVSLQKKLGETVAWSADTIQSVCGSAFETFKLLASEGRVSPPAGAVDDGMVRPVVKVTIQITNE